MTELSIRENTGSDSQHQRAMRLQQEAELLQSLVACQQEVASLLQQAAVHQRKSIELGVEVGNEVVDGQLRELEKELLRLVDFAFVLEGVALEHMRTVIKKTEAALHA